MKLLARSDPSCSDANVVSTLWKAGQDVGCSCAPKKISYCQILLGFKPVLNPLFSKPRICQPVGSQTDLCQLGAKGLASQGNSVVVGKCPDLDFVPWGRTAAAGVSHVRQQLQTQIQAQPTEMISTGTDNNRKMKELN